MAHAVANEFAKMRRLHVGAVAGAMILGVVGLTCIELTAPDFARSVGDPAGSAWTRLLLGLASAVPLASPVLVAVMASRQVEIEHQAHGWRMAQTAGLVPGRMIRAKFVAIGSVLVATILAQSAVVAAVGAVIGIEAPMPIARWTVYTASIAVIGLVLLALHLVIAAGVTNQLVGLGVGVLGVFVATTSSQMPTWVSHLTPWGQYAVAAPADYVEGGLVTVHPSYLGLVVMAAVAATVFGAVTHRFTTEV